MFQVTGGGILVGFCLEWVMTRCRSNSLILSAAREQNLDSKFIVILFTLQTNLRDFLQYCYHLFWSPRSSMLSSSI